MITLTAQPRYFNESPTGLRHVVSSCSRVAESSLVKMATSKCQRHGVLRSNNKSGFSLIEILLVVLVAGIMIAVLSNLTPTMNLLKTSSRENLARQIVAKKIEDIRAQGFDNLANGNNNFSDPRLLTLPQSAGNTIIEDCPTQVCTNGEPIKKVKIQVSWVENNKTKDFSATTLISKGGLR